ncbi:hypothetical protein BJX62DRAFT_127015 [Aspergillus germanicus]
MTQIKQVTDGSKMPKSPLQKAILVDSVETSIFAKDAQIYLQSYGFSSGPRPKPSSGVRSFGRIESSPIVIPSDTQASGYGPFETGNEARQWPFHILRSLGHMFLVSIKIISATIMRPFRFSSQPELSDCSFQPMRSRATALRLPELGVLAQS